MQLKQSKDETVSIFLKMNTGRKWKVENAVGRAESSLRLDKIWFSNKGTDASSFLACLPESYVPNGW